MAVVDREISERSDYIRHDVSKTIPADSPAFDEHEDYDDPSAPIVEDRGDVSSSGYIVEEVVIPKPTRVVVEGTHDLNEVKNLTITPKLSVEDLITRPPISTLQKLVDNWSRNVLSIEILKQELQKAQDQLPDKAQALARYILPKNYNLDTEYGSWVTVGDEEWYISTTAKDKDKDLPLHIIDRIPKR